MARTSRSRSVDHGYAWVVLGATFCMRVLIDGFWTCLGIIFVKWESSFGVSPAQTSPIGSILMLVIFAAAPVSSALSYRLTSRVVVVGAGILTVVCFFAISFVTQFWHLYIIMPFLGIGLGLGFHHAWSYYIFFFDKRFALAKTICASAAGIGVIAMPPVMEFLLSTYDWRGAFQITSAIMAHICVCGLLLQQPYSDKAAAPDAINVKDERTRTEMCIIFLRDIAKDFDLSLFHNVRFLFQSILNGFLLGMQMTSLIYLAPYAVSVGVSLTNSSLLMTGFGVTLLFTRMSPIGVMVDKQVVSASNLGGVMQIGTGILVMIIPLITRFEYLMILAVLYGFTQGIGGCMSFIIAAKSPGSRDKGPAADAWFLLSAGIGATICIYVCGFLTESTGTYTLSMILCGIGVMFQGFVLLLDPCFIRWQWRRENKRHVLSVVDMPTLAISKGMQ